MITAIRLHTHQLITPKFEQGKDLISYMGALQAQDYKMSKWAIGCRLKSGKSSEINAAIDNGEIIRTHVLRPTWHFVSPNNLKWMLNLSAQKIIASSASRDKLFNVPQALYCKCNDAIGKILEGNKCLTKQEIKTELNMRGYKIEPLVINRIMIRAEVDGIICSGKTVNHSIRKRFCSGYEGDVRRQ